MVDVAWTVVAMMDVALTAVALVAFEAAIAFEAVVAFEAAVAFEAVFEAAFEAAVGVVVAFGVVVALHRTENPRSRTAVPTKPQFHGGPTACTVDQFRCPHCGSVLGNLPWRSAGCGGCMAGASIGTHSATLSSNLGCRGATHHLWAGNCTEDATFRHRSFLCHEPDARWLG